jgi:dihydroorotase
MSLLVHGGTLVTPHGCDAGSILCEGGRIAALLEPGSLPNAEETIDATGKLVFPGFIDPHVHTRDPGDTEKETFRHSALGAAAGGITCFFAMPNTVPPLQAASQLPERIAEHEADAVVDFGVWGIAFGAENLHELQPMIRAGVIGIKLFWGYALDPATRRLVYDATRTDVVGPPDDAEVYDVFAEIAQGGGLLGVHCEAASLVFGRTRRQEVRDYDDLLTVRPAEAEAAAIAVGIEFARATRCAFHVVHLTSARGAELVRAAQRDGVDVSAETCPHYLTLTDEDYPRLGSLMKVYPPIRDAANCEALWEAVLDGTVCSLGSDHAPHGPAEVGGSLAAKPAGSAGVQTLAPLMLDQMQSGRATPERMAWLLSEGTARRYGVYPQKGSLLVGTDADLTIVDPRATVRVAPEWLRSLHPVSPWLGLELQGAPVATIVRGRVVMADGEVDETPHGRVVRPASQPAPPEQRAAEASAGV